MARQLSLVFGNRHGGRRRGAGRKPKGAQAGVEHRPRPEFVRRKPVLVTQRIAADCPSLRRAEVLAIFRRLVIKLSDETFAVVHWSLQTTHIHAVVEAQDYVVLARKLGGFFASPDLAPSARSPLTPFSARAQSRAGAETARNEAPGFSPAQPG